MENLNREQIDFVLDCVTKWITIREDNGLGPAGVPDPYHSALLPRLLSGDKPLESPPPKYFSRPWYDIVEKEEGCEISLSPRDTGDRVNIGNHVNWRWLDKEKGTLIHDSGLVCKYWEEERVGTFTYHDGQRTEKYTAKFLKRIK